MTGLVVLTTTELEVLEEAHLRTLGVQPPPRESPTGSEEEAHHGAARREAAASLVARGLTDPTGCLVERDDLGSLVATALDLRLASDRVVVLDRVIGPTGTGEEDLHGARLLHLSPAGVCVEDLDGSGLRGLGLLADPEDAVGIATAFLVPPDARDGAGEPFGAGPAPPGLMVALRRPTVLAEVSLLVPEEDRSQLVEAHLLALGPQGCFRSTRPAGPRDRGRPVRAVPVEGGGMRFAPVPTGWVGEWVGGVVRAMVAEESPREGTMAR